MPKTTNRDGTIRWDTEEPLAPLTDRQKTHLIELENIMSREAEGDNADGEKSFWRENVRSARPDRFDPPPATRIRGYRELLRHFASLERKYTLAKDTKYASYLEELASRRDECNRLCFQIEEALRDLAILSKLYTEVSEKTTSLHDASEQLISEQAALNSTIDRIADYVKYFKEVDPIFERLETTPALSVNSEAFFALLNKIEANMDVMLANPSFKETNVYLIKYRHCQSKAISLLRNYIFNLFSKITESIFSSRCTDASSSSSSSSEPSSVTETAAKEQQRQYMESMDAALALFYGRFQTILPKARPVIEQIEKKSLRSREYESLLRECHQHYWNQRASVLGPSVEKSLISVRERYNGDHCSLVRHSCALLLHASVDEHRLFYQFFSAFSSVSGGGGGGGDGGAGTADALTTYLESLCTLLYDALRPFIIHINHLETLAEICCILRIEILDEHVQNNLGPLEGFGNVCLQLLHDVQERLVFRAHLYLQSDVLNYNPSPGDLAYPEKLKMMEDIAESIREEIRRNRMRRISVSVGEPEGSGTETTAVTRRTTLSRNHVMTLESIPSHSVSGSSPADLHGMWYPTVRRTLVCLSRLYRCLDRSVFRSLSQEAIALCVRSIEKAKQEIEARASPLDAELFQIKHLLILREQIAPFQVDFTVKEYSIDFSKVKTAAFGLLEKSSRLFTLSNNALLEFLLEGAPQMKEQLIDSRKHVDTKLKCSCQRLIQHVTQLLVHPVLQLLEMEKLRAADNDNGENTNMNSSSSGGSSNSEHGEATAMRSAQQPQQRQQQQERILGSAKNVAILIGDTLRVIKFTLPGIQQSFQLYLANKETEFILLRPIKNNVIAVFTQIYQSLMKHYTPDEISLIACPMPEQVSVILSSATLAVVNHQGNNNDDEQTTSDATTKMTRRTESIRSSEDASFVVASAERVPPSFENIVEATAEGATI